MKASKLLTGAPLPMNTTEVPRIREFNNSLENIPLSVWASSGPYTTADNMDYIPLKDLLTAAKEVSTPPDVLILMGPFVDASHPQVKSGDTFYTTEGITPALYYM